MRLCTKWTWFVRSLGWEINQATESLATRRNGASKNKTAMTLHLPPKADIIQICKFNQTLVRRWGRNSERRIQVQWLGHEQLLILVYNFLDFKSFLLIFHYLNRLWKFCPCYSKHSLCYTHDVHNLCDIMSQCLQSSVSLHCLQLLTTRSAFSLI